MLMAARCRPSAFPSLWHAYCGTAGGGIKGFSLLNNGGPHVARCKGWKVSPIADRSAAIERDLFDDSQMIDQGGNGWTNRPWTEFGFKLRLGYGIYGLVGRRLSLGPGF
jgi:hypothetical protein